MLVVGGKGTRLCRVNFTLLELLATIAVMVILFSLLLPVFRRVLEKNYLIICMNNARQIAFSYCNYADDYGNPLSIFQCPAAGQAKLSSIDELDGNTAFLAPGKLQDIEKNGNWNNGHGNSPYYFDIGNPNPQVQLLMARKTNGYACIYDRNWQNHGGKVTLVDFEDCHYEPRIGLQGLWVRDDKRKIIRDDVGFPDID